MKKAFLLFLLIVPALFGPPLAAQTIKVSAMSVIANPADGDKMIILSAGDLKAITIGSLKTEFGDTFQPLDSDLTALAALTGTNTLYYRSAAGTWTAVTIGGGLNFSAGTLNTSATFAPLASPTFTGTPAAPTAVADNNSTQIATTAFYHGQKGTATPITAGTGTPGTSLKWAPIDHVHPRSETFVVAISDLTTAITTGTAKGYFRMPRAGTVTAVRASLLTASSSGSPTFDINENGTTILSTKLTIDASEKTSTTAATAAVISDSALAADAEITIDIDVAGTGATGGQVQIDVVAP